MQKWICEISDLLKNNILFLVSISRIKKFIKTTVIIIISLFIYY